MTANVSFYLIAILALRVKGHSLQEKNFLGNVLFVDHHVKKIYKINIMKYQSDVLIECSMVELEQNTSTRLMELD